MTELRSTLLLLADGRLPSGGHAHSGGLEEAVVAGRVFDATTLAAWLAGRLATSGRVDATLAAATVAALVDATALDAADTATTIAALVDATALNAADTATTIAALVGATALDAADTATTIAALVGATALDATDRARNTVAPLAAAALDAVAALDAEAGARCPSPALRRASRAQGRGLLRAARRMWPAPLLDEVAAWRKDGAMWPIALGTVGFTIGASGAEVAAIAAHASTNGPAWAATRLLGLDPFAVARCLADLAADVDATARSAVLAAASGDIPTLDAHGAPLIEIGAQTHADWEVRLFAS